MVRPYTRVRIPWVASQLNVPEGEVEQLLVGLILDGRLAARIHQPQQVPGAGGRGGGVEGTAGVWGRGPGCEAATPFTQARAPTRCPHTHSLLAHPLAARSC